MAEIRSAYIERYTRALNAVSKRAQDALMRLLSSIPDSMWTDDYALARDLATEYIIESCGLTAQAAGQCADDFYEGLRVAQLGKVSGVDAEPDFDEDALRGEIDRYMEDAANGDIEAFRSGIASQVDYTAKRAAGSMVMSKAAKDPKRPRYARVPTGPETCRFCIMLASRGFVYTTARSAGEENHYHPRCDCRIVPSWDKDPAVQGYDQDYYLDVYKHPEDHPEVTDAINERRRELYAEKKEAAEEPQQE